MPNVPDHYYTQSSVIPFRWVGKALRVLVINNNKRTRWIVPKGVVDPSMTPQESAAHEALEEAGIVGQVWSDAIGTYRYDKWKGTCDVTVFPMEVAEEHDTWLEEHRERKWLSPTDAAKLMLEPELREMLQGLETYLLASGKRPSSD